MLLADIHGKVVPEALSSEDYLTSAVFGELRWIPPSVFWTPLFGRAKRVGLPGSLADFLPRLDDFSLDVVFWKNFEQGEPDLLLIFSNGREAFRLLIEVKLNSYKSGTGEFDQLARYMSIMEQLPAPSALLYLTPRPSEQEVEESLQASKRPDHFRPNVFTLQWQDILDICRDTVVAVPVGQTKTILTEVSSFLQFRELEFFEKFRRTRQLDDIEPQGLFAESCPVAFRRENDLPIIDPVPARW